jgi:hypothetical protein
MQFTLIPTHLNFAIELFSFVFIFNDWKTIFELKKNTFTHANIIKVQINEL